MTPIMVAASHAHVDILEKLLQNRQCRNALSMQDRDGNTALHHAARSKAERAMQCVQLLCADCSLLVMQDRKGLTAQDVARQSKSDDVAHHLAERLRALEMQAHLAAQELEEEEAGASMQAAARRTGVSDASCICLALTCCAMAAPSFQRSMTVSGGHV